MLDKDTVASKMREIWAQENVRMFKGILPRPLFYVKRMPDATGLWFLSKNGQGSKHTITIDNHRIRTMRQLQRVMVHEMIHQLQSLQKSVRTQQEMHGRFFRSHCIRILATFSLECYSPG
jgi:hypothetical protein